VGHPDHLKGDAIPPGARLLAVADVFDALTSARPYKEALSTEAARERIAAGIGEHFEPAATEAFLGLLDTRADFLLPPRIEPTNDIHPQWARHDFLDE
jgi:HD-GYP domain-containing protein (c-di-GMP phosphodiesterase class II)